MKELLLFLIILLIWYTGVLVGIKIRKREEEKEKLYDKLNKAVDINIQHEKERKSIY